MSNSTKNKSKPISIFDTDIELDSDINLNSEIIVNSGIELDSEMEVHSDIKLDSNIESDFDINLDTDVSKQAEIPQVVLDKPLQVVLPEKMCNLFRLLSKERLKIAKEEKLKPFYIFTNKSLADMAMLLPTTEEEFAEVFGVGEAKVNKYSKKFLDIIISFIGENPDTEPLPILLDTAESQRKVNVKSLHKAERKWIEAVISPPDKGTSAKVKVHKETRTLSHAEVKSQKEMKALSPSETNEEKKEKTPPLTSDEPQAEIIALTPAGSDMQKERKDSSPNDAKNQKERHKPTSYTSWIEKYPEYVIVRKEGHFYVIRGIGADLLHEKLGLKLMTNTKISSVGSPHYQQITNVLKDNKQKYVLIVANQVVSIFDGTDEFPSTDSIQVGSATGIEYV